ncbi:MAG TPA: SprT-like domain-containing protein [Pirellulales bacterium]|nr:SprT-like domain-containing protein [Pirellulales bacterium]
MCNQLSITRTITALEAMASYFVEVLGGRLYTNYPPPSPIITINPRGRTNAIGWFSGNRWNSGSLGRVAEINICPEQLAKGRDLLSAVLLHELVHHANWLDGIRDCSPTQYHNKAFKARCQRIDLICEFENRRYGWSRTMLSPELAFVVDAMPFDNAAFSMFRIDEPQRRVGSPLRKWSCHCGNIWSARTIDLSCRRCGQALVKVLKARAA